MKTPIFNTRRFLFTTAAIVIGWGNLFLWRIGHDPWYIMVITMTILAGALAWFWRQELRGCAESKEKTVGDMREPMQIIPWFNTDTLAMQVLATIENEERDRMEQA